MDWTSRQQHPPRCRQRRLTAGTPCPLPAGSRTLRPLGSRLPARPRLPTATGAQTRRTRQASLPVGERAIGGSFRASRPFFSTGNPPRKPGKQLRLARRVACRGFPKVLSRRDAAAAPAKRHAVTAAAFAPVFSTGPFTPGASHCRHESAGAVIVPGRGSSRSRIHTCRLLCRTRTRSATRRRRARVPRGRGTLRRRDRRTTLPRFQPRPTRRAHRLRTRNAGGISTCGHRSRATMVADGERADSADADRGRLHDAATAPGCSGVRPQPETPPVFSVRQPRRCTNPAATHAGVTVPTNTGHGARQRWTPPLVLARHAPRSPRSGHVSRPQRRDDSTAHRQRRAGTHGPSHRRGDTRPVPARQRPPLRLWVRPGAWWQPSIRHGHGNVPQDNAEAAAGHGVLA